MVWWACVVMHRCVLMLLAVGERCLDVAEISQAASDVWPLRVEGLKMSWMDCDMAVWVSRRRSVSKRT